MRAGQLRHRLHIQKRDPDARDPATNEPLPDDHPGAWKDVAQVWGEWIDLSGRSFFEAAAAQSEVTARVRIRHRRDLGPAMRVLHGTRVGEIRNILEPDGKRREMHLMVEEIQP